MLNKVGSYWLCLGSQNLQGIIVYSSSLDLRRQGYIAFKKVFHSIAHPHTFVTICDLYRDIILKLALKVLIVVVWKLSHFLTI